jgi:hypothetical protein
MAGEPYSTDSLFRPSETWDVDWDADNQVMTIDNFYENADDIHHWITNRDYPLWKFNEERDSANGNVYNDCRISDLIAHPTRQYQGMLQNLTKLCNRHWFKGKYGTANHMEFNVFQTITNFDNKLQHYPHIDSPLDCPDEYATINMLVYLDKHEQGGTAIYGGAWITNDEASNLLFEVEKEFKVEHIIPAKFNRCVLFPGNRLHGAWIDDYTKYSGDEWRYSQVMFLQPSNQNEMRNHGQNHDR